MTPQQVIEKLEAERAARLDPLDLPRTLTQRQYDEYLAETEHLDQTLVNVRHAAKEVSTAASNLNSIDVRSVNLDVWEGFLVPARKQLCNELLALPRFVRERSEKELQTNLEMSIDSGDRGLHHLPGSTVYSLKGLRLGDLMIEAGLIDETNESLRQFSGLKWGGSLKDIARERAALASEKVEAEDEYAQARAYLDRLIPDEITIETT